ncbi:MAG: T9SS type A sorting domain-containing protein [Sphingobacteriales bacterium]|nr:MAG: T9SS type A sorting domain-containing protein [Sphingobacteriales bacterium]
MKKAIALIPFLIICIRFQGQNIQFAYFNKVLADDTMNILMQASKPFAKDYYSFGSYTSSSHRALYVSKLDENGNLMWIKDFEKGPPGDPYTLGVIESGTQILVEDGNIAATYEKSLDVCFTKFNLDGDTVLHKKYVRPGWQLGKQIISTADGGYVIAGMEQNATADTVKAYALKIDAWGNFEWDKRYLTGNDARFFTVQHTPWDGGFIFGGMGYSASTGYDMFVVKTLADGDTLWTKRYGNELNDCGAKVVNLTTYEEWLSGQEPNYLMTGCFKEGIVKKLYLSVIDENGVVKWEKKHNFLPEISSFQVFPVVKADKSFIGSGYYQPDGFTPQPYIAAFHADGNLNWAVTPTIHPDKHVYLKDLQPTPDGGYVLAGYQYSSPQTAWVLKIDSLGNTCSYIGCDSTVVVEVLPGVPSNSNPEVSATVYPVPASTRLNIRYQIPAGILPSGNAGWYLYDITGRQVAETTLTGNNGIEEISVEHLPAGIYYYQVLLPLSGQAVASGKILVSEK